MNLIKLDAIDSTNSYLRELSTKSSIDDYTVVTAEYQTRGRGQMGTTWESQKGKNLMFSLFKKINCIEINEQFYISIATSLVIFRALKQFNIPELKIKWPNDILSANQKICGILIENVINNRKINAAVIGVGLNVNQTEFSGVLNASSLRNLTSAFFDREEILMQILSQATQYEKLLHQNKFGELKREYEQSLFRLDKPSTFKNPKGELLTGIIKGVSDEGKLKVLLEDHIINEFDLKEIKLLY